MSDRLLLIRSCVHGHLRTHWVKEGDGIIRCPVESTVLEGIPDEWVERGSVEMIRRWAGVPDEDIPDDIHLKDARAILAAAVFGETP